MSFQQTAEPATIDQAHEFSETPIANTAVEVPQAGDDQTHEGVHRLMTYGPETPQFAAFMSC